MRASVRGGWPHALTVCLVSVLVSLAMGTDAAAEATPAPAPKPKTAVEQFDERVTALQRVARRVHELCGDPEQLRRDEETVDARILGLLGAELATAAKTIADADAVIADDKKNAAEKATAKRMKASAEAAKKVAEAHVATLEAKRLLPAEIEKHIQDIAEAQKVMDDTTTTAAKKATATKTIQDATAAKAKAEKELDEARAKDVVHPRFAAFEKGHGLCEELCTPDSKEVGRPIDFCAFRHEVPATAAVIADFRSVDALFEYVGVPRRRLEAAFGPSLALQVTELPSDPYAKSRPPLPASPAVPPKSVLSSEPEPAACKNRSVLAKATGSAAPVAAATGLAGIDLSAASAQTAEVALAALAKVIEDRAKREALVWFLEKMHEEVCGKEDEETQCAPSEVSVARDRVVVVQNVLREAEANRSALKKKLNEACDLSSLAAKAVRTAKDAAAKDVEAEKAKKAVEAVETAEQLRSANEALVSQKRTELTTATAALEKARTDFPTEPVCRAAILQEVRTYWLPTTCALARNRQDYVQYGGGASLLRALQGAVASDVRNWPGTAAGVGGGAVFWATTEHGLFDKAPELAFRCAPVDGGPKEDPVCRPMVQLRRATARMVGQIQGGANPLASLYLYGTAIDELNHKGEGLYNPGFQMAACIGSLPQVFQKYEDHASETTSDRKNQIQALLLAGLASAPACWTVVGEGWDAEECGVFSPGVDDRRACDKGASQKKALSRHGSLERLTTILKWHGQTGAATDRVVAQWDVVKTSWESFFATLQALRKSGGGAPFVPPSFDPSKVNDAKTFAEVIAAFDAHVKDTARTAQQTEQVKLLKASAALARASLDFGVALTAGLGGALEPTLYPGLPAQKPELKAALELTSQHLARTSRYIVTVESALQEDWGALVARIVEIVRTDLMEECKKDAKCFRLADRLSRYSGLFSALISERDPEKVAQALDAAAMPIGGWRHKQIPGSTTISLAAFPGFAGGGEWRFGQYGVVRENGGDTYFAAPTLQMPLGVDIAHAPDSGFPNFAVFIPLLDPAAYLHYDPDNAGRLPGAQILTALSPGVSLRFPLGRSPFSVMGSFVVRPNFRAWQSDVASPGATALQALLSISVDVTLLELWAERPM